MKVYIFIKTMPEKLMSKFHVLLLGVKRHRAWLMDTTVSEECTTSIFRVTTQCHYL